MDWLSHTATAVLSFVAGSVLPFVLKWRQQNSNDWQALCAVLSTRVAALEKRVEELHAEHSECLQMQGELRAKIAALEKNAAHEPRDILPYGQRQ